MTDVPKWLAAMRAITGMTETPGSASNPNILKMRDYIAEKFPEQAAYCALYTGDDIAWCGLAADYCMATADISGPFDLENSKGDQDKCWMWARSWADWPDGILLDAPRLGCVVVMEREGGGHVTFYEGTEGNTYRCRGGNQSDAVTLDNYEISRVIALVWPAAAGPVPPAERRELSRGDQGADVAALQATLGLPADGDFGAITEAGVKGYQGACGLAKDGVVGPMTWDALDDLDARVAAGDDGIGEELSAAIDELAADSSLANFSWPDRGRAPSGYYAGMGKAYALALLRLQAGDAAAGIMAQAPGDADDDALEYYRDEFEDVDIEIGDGGVDTLRALFVLITGLGMRESSGNSWEGRDMSASNVSPDTCEAGLLQTSYNIRSCSPDEIVGLFNEYMADPNGFRETFTRGLSPTTSNLDNYGSGADGVASQWLSKYCPAYTILVSGIGLRKLRGHWGPIGRKEVDIIPQVDDFLIDVERLMDTTPEPGPEPEPEPEPGEPAEVKISIVSKGNVTVTIDQHAIEVMKRSERYRRKT